MLKRIIPGHFRAYTFWLMLLVGVCAYLATHRFLPVAGVELMVIGMFLADQATHLDQEAHSAPAETGIERLIQYDKWMWVYLGTGIAMIGIRLIFTP